MTDARTEAALQDAFRRASRSMLQYVGEAYPWASEAERATLDQLRKLIAEEYRAIGALAGFLRRRRIGLPHVGAYAEPFTTMNYISLDRLLPLLAGYQRQAVAELTRDRDRAGDPEAQAEIGKLVALGQQHLTTLEGMVSAQPQLAAS